MEFAAAALTSLAGAGATTAGAGAAGAGILGAEAATLLAPTVAGGSLLAGGSTVFSILSGTATALSVMSTMRAGEAKAQSLELAAGDAETETRLEANKTIERKTSLRKALIETIGERDVAAAASGVDLSFGTPATARREAVTDTERALSLEDSGEEFRRARLLERSASYRRMAAESRSGGLGRAAALAFEGGARLFRRG